MEIGENCYIGFGAIIRGDFGKIKIGNASLVEECVVIHTAELTEIGNKVIIEHMAMIHDATIHDETLIGMKSMICEYATIGERAIIEEQSLVRKKTTSLLENSLQAHPQRWSEMSAEATGKDWHKVTLPIKISFAPIIKVLNKKFLKIR